jgi:hypothetical protein
MERGAISFRLEEMRRAHEEIINDIQSERFYLFSRLLLGEQGCARPLHVERDAGFTIRAKIEGVRWRTTANSVSIFIHFLLTPRLLLDSHSPLPLSTREGTSSFRLEEMRRAYEEIINDIQSERFYLFSRLLLGEQGCARPLHVERDAGFTIRAKIEGVRWRTTANSVSIFIHFLPHPAITPRHAHSLPLSTWRGGAQLAIRRCHRVM